MCIGKVCSMPQQQRNVLKMETIAISSNVGHTLTNKLRPVAKTEQVSYAAREIHRPAKIASLKTVDTLRRRCVK